MKPFFARPTLLTATLLALPTATTQATNYYFDVTSGTAGFGSPSGSYSWNNASPRYWTTDSTGAGTNVTPAAAYGSLDGWIFGSSSSDLAGTSFTLTGSGTGVNGITINSASCHVTLSGAVNIIPSNAANTPQTWYVAAGSTLTEALTFNTYGMNMGSNKITLAGGGTINFNTSLGYNRPSTGAGLEVNGASTLVVNLKAAAPTTLGAPATAGFQDGLTLTAGKLNFATAASADAFKGFATAAKPFAIKGGTLDNTSGAAMTLTVGSAGISLGGDFTFAGSSDLNLGTAKVVLTDTRQITVTQNNLTVGGIISGSTYGLTKAGAGTLTLTNSANSYGGATLINNGTLIVSGSGSINSSSSITVAAGARLAYNSNTALTKALTLSGTGTSNANRAVFGGSGPIGAALTLDNTGDILSLSNSPGIQEFTVGQAWNSFSYDWETNDFTGTTAGTAFDQIKINNDVSGTLNLTGGIGSYVLNVLSLDNLNAPNPATNFSETNRSWNILTTTGGISNFNRNYWTINTANFANDETGNWSLTSDGYNLVLNYTVVPEPAAAMLGSLGMLCLLRRRR